MAPKSATHPATASKTVTIVFHDPFDEQRVQHFFEREYVDRGIVKWQGYFLSDHTSALQQLQKKADNIAHTHLEQQTIPLIQRLLLQAADNDLPVLIQFNQIDDRSSQLLVVTGMVDWMNAEACQINGQPYELTDIRGVIMATAETNERK